MKRIIAVLFIAVLVIGSFGCAFFWDTHSVMYIGNTHTAGCCPEDTAKYFNGDVVTVRDHGTLTKTGHSFLGWNTSQDGSGTARNPGSTFLMGSSDVQLYAQWSANSYTVSYNGNGHDSGIVPGSEEYAYGAEVVIEASGTLSKEGLTFSHWNTESDDSGVSYDPGDTFSMTAAEVVLYAIWEEGTYTVRYHGNVHTAGLLPSNQSFYSGETITVSNHGTLEKEGYTFSNWNTQTDGSGTTYTEGQQEVMGSADLELYAQWTPVQYSIMYHLDGGTNNAGNPSEYTIESNTITFQEPTKTGYDFIGWYEDQGFEKSISSIPTGSTGDKGIYAQWIVKNLNITFNANGGTGSMDLQSLDYGDTQPLAENQFSRVGYNFAGWALSADGNVVYTDTADFTMGTTNVQLYAKWTPIEYQITYILDGGTNNANNPSTYTIESSEIVFNVPTKADYVFCGWFDDSDFVNEITSIPNGSTENISIYVKWLPFVSKLFPDDETPNISFGSSVAIDGEYAIVGAYHDSPTGSAYIYHYYHENWLQVDKLIPDDSDCKYFGWSVDIDDDFAIVGVCDDDVGYYGRAYIFHNDGTHWKQVCKITPDDPNDYNHFGYTVAIEGNFAVVGSFAIDGVPQAPGSIYIFQYNGMNWNQVDKISAPDASNDDHYGYRFDINNQNIIVSSHKGVYVLENTTEGWIQTKIYNYQNSSSVAINKDYVFIGTFSEPNSVGGTGVVHVMRKGDDGWENYADIIADDGNRSGQFGFEVGINNEYAVISDPYFGSQSGAIYVYHNTGTWVQEKKVVPDDTNSCSFFGKSLDITDQLAVIGQLDDNPETATVILNK